MGFLMGQALGFLLDDPVIGQAVEFFHGEVGHGYTLGHRGKHLFRFGSPADH
jgi:hypothetical protein